MVWVVGLKYGNKRQIRMSRGMPWQYPSSLFIVFLTIFGLMLKLFELPLKIISILLLISFSNINTAEKPSRSICFMWVRSLGERCGLCLLIKSSWRCGNYQCILLLGNIQIYRGPTQNGSSLYLLSQLGMCQCGLAVHNCIKALKAGGSWCWPISMLLVS